MANKKVIKKDEEVKKEVKIQEKKEKVKVYRPGKGWHEVKK